MAKKRCDWVFNDPLMIAYHDKEWGVPTFDDRTIFEFLILETFQAGLSWITIMRKRENFRKAFDHFDYSKIAEFGDKKLNELLQNTGIIRNRLKINAAISNAKAFMKIQQDYGSFGRYIWGFVGGKPIQNNFKTISELPAKTKLSDEISKDMKKKGFKFAGSTVVYAHMQATGMVNDHTTDCFRYLEIQQKYLIQSLW